MLPCQAGYATLSSSLCYPVQQAMLPCSAGYATLFIISAANGIFCLVSKFPPNYIVLRIAEPFMHKNLTKNLNKMALCILFVLHTYGLLSYV